MLSLPSLTSLMMSFVVVCSQIKDHCHLCFFEYQHVTCIFVAMLICVFKR
ncbi:hypothetical protein Lalb_Chr20g0115071 [Lupinus albus]|uniref:Uncharacterized protein n=1 Tax=Lupinus albus TaxID=3870 RepID=A0A6A4NK12_LUPAL|nr:hypothetical protein Lalb_Chr20g0115071 [Lupinus albus]